MGFLDKLLGRGKQAASSVGKEAERLAERDKEAIDRGDKGVGTGSAPASTSTGSTGGGTPSSPPGVSTGAGAPPPASDPGGTTSGGGGGGAA